MLDLIFEADGAGLPKLRTYWMPRLVKVRFDERPSTMWLESAEYSKKAEKVLMLPQQADFSICAFAADTRRKRTATLQLPLASFGSQ